jgi:hypothetical protein
MCDLCIYDIGYVCSDCEEEFKAGYTGGEGFDEIRESLKTFMESPKVKVCVSSSKEAVEDFFNTYRS